MLDTRGNGPVIAGLMGLILVLAFVILTSQFFGGCSKAQSQSTGTTFLFTWSGDDGMSGTASGYEIRLDTRPIVAADTLTWWNNAPIRRDVPPPTPKLGGTPDSVEVTGLASQTHYYAVMRVRDEVPNWSGFSNVAEKTTADLIWPDPPQNLR